VTLLPATSLSVMLPLGIVIAYPLDTDLFLSCIVTLYFFLICFIPFTLYPAF
jgi:hypothetical protein